jgi:GH15 family glucan-1,4-alpha-glucosidase
MNVHQKTVDAAAVQQSLDLAVIGNGRTAALVNPMARIVWWCFPRFDGDPVFCRLLAGDEEKGFTDVLLDGFVSAHSEYVRNTAIVTTVLTDKDGGAVRITDFAPRFQNYERTFRPPQLMRIIEPVAGLPRITIRFRPAAQHGKMPMQRAFGSNHIRYTGGDFAIRLTTDAPLSYVDREAPFVLSRPLSLVFGADTPLEGDIATTCR